MYREYVTKTISNRCTTSIKDEIQPYYHHFVVTVFVLLVKFKVQCNYITLFNLTF